MLKINQKVIKVIANTNVSCLDPFGWLIQSIYFPNGKSALYLDYNEDRIALLVPPSATASEQRNQIFLNLTELLAVLKELEKRQLIFVMPVESSNNSSPLYYQGLTQFSQGQLETQYLIGDNLLLQILGNQVKIINNSSEILMGSLDKNSLFISIHRYLRAIILPTPGLSDFIKHGYCFQELYLTKSANKIAIIAATATIISLLIAVFSLFLSFSNQKHTYLGINEIENISISSNEQKTSIRDSHQ